MFKTIVAVVAVLVAMSFSQAEAKYNAVANDNAKPAAAKSEGSYKSSYSKGSKAKSKSGYAKKSGSSKSKASKSARGK